MSIDNSRARARLSVLICLVFAGSVASEAERFYPDDPLRREPPPRSVGDVQPVDLDNLVDFYKNTLHKKGERNQPGKVYPSQGTNTLDELPDSAWFTNRHTLKRMSRDELARGPNVTGPPSGETFTITAAKSQGVTPGFTIQDERGRRYLVKFDPPQYPELATAADVVGAHFFYALGYYVPENYVFRFRREQLAIKPGVQFTDRFNRTRVLKPSDLDELLRPLSRNANGTWRAIASLYLGGKPLGGFKYYKRRADDPNELAPHEHLRVLRGLYVFAAWLNHTDAKSLNTLDTLVEENGVKYVRHHLIDFGASLGSDSVDAKDPRLGHEYFIDPKFDREQLLTLGFHVPKYARVDYPSQPAVGNFTAQDFQADRWKGNYPNAAFESRLWGDEFWGATHVLAFTDDDIRTLVHTGEYSDPNAEQIIGDVLIARRDLIGRTFLARMSPLTNFRMDGNQLRFEDLAVLHGFRPAVSHKIAWSRFANRATRLDALAEGLPSAAPAGSYFAAAVSGDPSGQGVTVYVRRQDNSWAVVGVEREGRDRWEAR